MRKLGKRSARCTGGEEGKVLWMWSLMCKVAFELRGKAHDPSVGSSSADLEVDSSIFRRPQQPPLCIIVKWQGIRLKSPSQWRYLHRFPRAGRGASSLSEASKLAPNPLDLLGISGQLKRPCRFTSALEALVLGILASILCTFCFLPVSAVQIFKFQSIPIGNTLLPPSLVLPLSLNSCPPQILLPIATAILGDTLFLGFALPRG
jgi:hypothetical protein